MKMHLKMSSAKWRPFYPAGDELLDLSACDHYPTSFFFQPWKTNRLQCMWIEIPLLEPRACFNVNTIFQCIGISSRKSWNRLIFIMGIPVLTRRHLWLKPWWRHQMETFSALLTLCAGNSPVSGEFPAQRPVTRSLIFSLICVWINGWVNNREAGDLRRYRAHYDVSVICGCFTPTVRV